MKHRKNPIEDMRDDDLEAWFAERSQADNDDTREDEASERLSIGLALMVLTIAAIIGLNAWLGTQGYGA